MISYEKLQQLADALAEYRGNGRENVLFDSRDRGNYSAYYFDNTVDMLKKADPTGLALGLLLSEMIEATIVGSKVLLERVLREEGFVDELRRILALEKELAAEVAAPAGALIARLTESMAQISPELGTPSRREVAICLRDAIYCMDKGLTMRWLKCDATPMNTHAALSPIIRQYQSVSEFIDALRDSLPLGAHLGRLGKDGTVIGIKQPGRIAFLSSLRINEHTGAMIESRASGQHMAEALDLDTAIERYPAWLSHEYVNGGSYTVIHGADSHALDHVAKLPRDRLIWLAMVVEMTAQRMAATPANSVDLVETANNALTAPRSDKPNLPVPFRPNWSMGRPTLEAMLDSMQFSEWEKDFLRPAIAGLEAKDLLPEGDTEMAINNTTRVIEPWNEDDYFEKSRLVRDCSRLKPFSPSLIGSREEMEQAYRSMLGSNLANYLLAWGNLQFMKKWDEIVPWFKERLKENLLNAINMECVHLRDPGTSVTNGVNFYSQSRKHKMYNPRCFYNERLDVDGVAYILPENDHDLVAMLNLKNIEALPAFLRGWERRASWASGNGAKPYNCSNEHWCYAAIRNNLVLKRPLEATAHLNRMSAPEFFERMEQRAQAKKADRVPNPFYRA